MATSNNDINININAKDNASGKVKKVTLNLRELGEKVRRLGTFMTASITLPLVGGLALLGRAGSDAAKQVNGLQQELKDAIAAGDVDKVAALNKQMAELPENVRRSARAWNDIQAALKPANDALNEAKTILLEALVSVLRDLAPVITGAANSIRDLAKWFSDLSPAAKNAVLGVVAFAAAIGPIVAIVGQVVWVIGTLQGILTSVGLVGPTAAGGIAAVTTALKGAAAMAGPIAALAAAIGLLLVVLDKFGPDAWLALKRLFALGMRPFVSDQQFIQGSQNLGLIGNARGGNVVKGRPVLVGERGPEILNPTMNGTIIPNHQLAAVGGGGGVTIVYQPTISTASPDEIEKFGKYVRQAIRRSP